jgi:hypothetical protein
MWKRLTGSMAFVLVALSALSGSASARGDSEESAQTVIQSRKFTIAKGQCSQLPAGLEVQGVGLERTKTVVDDEDGGVTYSLSSTITGTATDNVGGTYTFRYQLRIRPVRLPGSAIVTDTFSLTGTGAANGMSTFFRLRATLDAGANPTAFTFLEQTGNPFGCDPL